LSSSRKYREMLGGKVTEAKEKERTRLGSSIVGPRTL